ncbi:MAG: hypothetical protein DMF87_17200 [Acidobacteria bacterium]|nr:MAG: hypothetical protein DMF87_17200 [Acidobacteriota bacterium]
MVARRPLHRLRRSSPDAEAGPVHTLPVTGDRKPIPFVVTTADETEAAFSPDGRWIAYSSDESGRRDVYVREFVPTRVQAMGTVKFVISTAGAALQDAFNGILSVRLVDGRPISDQHLIGRRRGTGDDHRDGELAVENR